VIGCCPGKHARTSLPLNISPYVSACKKYAHDTSNKSDPASKRNKRTIVSLEQLVSALSLPAHPQNCPPTSPLTTPSPCPPAVPSLHIISNTISSNPSLTRLTSPLLAHPARSRSTLESLASLAASVAVLYSTRAKAADLQL
jgi:hypothetical protein